MNPLVAHRGWSGKAPENTMAAFRLAMDHPLIDWIELDVQLSKDGNPVVIHDYTLNRTTNGRGEVKAYTFQQLSEFDAGNWFDRSYKGEKIPSLEQVLQATYGKIRLNIEIKTAGDLYPGLELKVIELIHLYQVKHQVCITSFDHQAVKKVREIDPMIPTGLILSGKPLLIREQMKAAGANLLSMDYKYLTKGFVSEMMKEGYGMMAWTVNDRSIMAKIAAMHPNLMICTNHPDRFMDAQPLN
ncbi:MAG TPA: glycerophosphodiester phosphodiesterase family protein [Bacilli bacterium]